MTLIYNIKPAVLDIEITKNDTLDMSFNVQLYNTVTEQWEDYDMTGMRLDVTFRRIDGRMVKSLNTLAGGGITIATSQYRIYAEGFDENQWLEYDVQVTDVSDVFTIQKGKAHIVKEQTQ